MVLGSHVMQSYAFSPTVLACEKWFTHGMRDKILGGRIDKKVLVLKI